MMANDYEMPCNSISVRNLQADAIVEKVRQIIGNIIHTFIIKEWKYSLQCILQRSIHHYNWDLVGTLS